jgi:hypothetical protein
MTSDSKLRCGDLVQVRTKEEILRTLDRNGQLEKLPFMPEMFEFCGKQFRVFRRAHKTCDPPNGVGGRRMARAVHLEGTRCSGDAHGGCQAGCLLFWKEEWLTKIENPSPPLPGLSHAAVDRAPDRPGDGCTEHDVIAGTRSSPVDASEPIYVCQSTQVEKATTPLAWWDVRQYIEDYRSGNVRLSQLLVAFLFTLYAKVASAGIGFGAALRWLYDRVQTMRGATPFPLRVGAIARGRKTPAAKLDLEPGELVKVRGYQAILATLNEDSYNRGMYFDPEMVEFCGGTYRVLDRIRQIINEKTGQMMQMKNDCIVLDGVVCRACYAKNRRFCPRSIYPYWREIWLERASANEARVENSTRTPRGRLWSKRPLVIDGCSRNVRDSETLLHRR